MKRLWVYNCMCGVLSMHILMCMHSSEPSIAMLPQPLYSLHLITFPLYLCVHYTHFECQKRKCFSLIPSFSYTEKRGALFLHHQHHHPATTEKRTTYGIESLLLAPSMTPALIINYTWAMMCIALKAHMHSVPLQKQGHMFKGYMCWGTPVHKFWLICGGWDWGQQEWSHPPPTLSLSHYS